MKGNRATTWCIFALRAVVASSTAANAAEAEAPAPEVEVPVQAPTPIELEPAAPPSEAPTATDSSDNPPPDSGPTAPLPPPPTRERRVVLTVSGGISLGSYEAGLNWALLRLIKASQRGATPAGAFAYPMDLVSMTGASAGNINAFLSAVEWFSTPSPEHPAASPRWTAEANLFWDAWIPVGLDQLFPGGKSCGDYKLSLGGSGPCGNGDGTYDATDAVFSRRAFARIIDALERRMAEPFASTSRTFPIGVTVSKVKPERVDGASLQSLDVKTQRFAVLLTARVRDRELVFTQPDAKNTALVGNQLFLPSRNGEVDHGDVLRLIQASSAFPLAFGPVELAYCLPAEHSSGDCQKTQKERFFDGGLFDNLPMGLALETLAQTDTFPAGGAAPGIDYSLMYLDPARRRNLSLDTAPSAQPRAADAGHGIDYLLSLVGRFISVARSYELQSSVRFGSGVLARPEGTSRYLPIFGGYLGAFAGFLARPFREFDFHVGVYDGIYQIASLTCDGAVPSNPQYISQAEISSLRARRAECMLEKVQTYLELLSIAPDSATGFVVQKTLSLELRELMPADRWPAFERKHHAVLDKLAAAPAPRQPPASPTTPARDDWIMAKLHAGMQKVRAAHLATGQEPGFTSALDLLGDLSGYRFGSEDRCGEVLFRDPDALIGSVARQLAWRIVEIEEAAESASSIAAASGAASVKRVGPPVADGTQFLTETYFNGLEYENRVRWSPSSVPSATGGWGKLWDALVPYYVTGEALNGGLELGYLPTLHLWGSGSGLTVPAAPLSWSREFDTLGARAGLGYALSGRWRSFSRLEAGSYFRIDYAKDPDGWVGAEVAVQLLFNHLRISANVDFYHAIQADVSPVNQDRWELTGASLRLGLADLNGALYWIGRAL